jgi:hypothetical protein
MAQRARFSEWSGEVDTLCRHHLGCSWQDLSGDDPPLRRSHEAGDTPIRFVQWWAEKYDLCLVRTFPNQDTR